MPDASGPVRESKPAEPHVWPKTIWRCSCGYSDVYDGMLEFMVESDCPHCDAQVMPVLVVPAPSGVRG